MINPWYPLAVQHILRDHYGIGSLEPRNTAVLHITEGTTASGAIATFEASVKPNRVSAHFVIDRDGTVTQLVSLLNTAWHASQCNAHSVGIEHVALSAEGAARLNQQYQARIAAGQQKAFEALPATDLQYAASAKLLQWICEQLQIPVDRAHIRTHNEASPRDGHTLCCTGALNPDRLVIQAQRIPI